MRIKSINEFWHSGDEGENVTIRLEGKNELSRVVIDKLKDFVNQFQGDITLYWNDDILDTSQTGGVWNRD